MFGDCVFVLLIPSINKWVGTYNSSNHIRPICVPITDNPIIPEAKNFV